MVRIFGLNITRTRGAPKRTYDLTDDDREKGMLIRDLKFQKRKLQEEIELLSLQAERDDLYRDLHGDEENDTDALFQSFLVKLMGGGVPPSSAHGITPSAPPSMSDEQLRTIKESVPPKILKMAKRMTDEQIVEFARLHYPEIFQYDEDTRKRALAILRE